MQLAPQINRRIARMQDHLRGKVPLETVLDLVQDCCSPWGANVYLQPDSTLAAYASCTISGSYDSSKKRRPIDIMLHFNILTEVRMLKSIISHPDAGAVFASCLAALYSTN